MPRAPEPPRLHLRAARIRDGRVRTHATWVILDGGKEKSTGCGSDDRRGAEEALATYIAGKHQPSRRKAQELEDIPVADVVSIYLTDRAPDHADPAKTARNLAQALEWWGDKTLADVHDTNCRAYIAWRCTMPIKSAKPEVTGNEARMVTPQGARPELEYLRAAIIYHRRKKLHSEHIDVWLPPKGASRQRYLTRREVAKMLWIAWRRRENARVLRGPRKGEPVLSPNRPSRHIARFILIGIYTGTRAAAIGGAAFRPTPGHSWIDLKTGLFYRRDQLEIESNKRTPTVQVPRRLLMHLRRWRVKNPAQKFVVEWRGKPVKEVNNGFGVVRALAGLGEDVVPHTLRHTCATWLSQRGAAMSAAAAYLGMSEIIYDKVYRKLSPTIRSAGFQNPPIWEIFDPKYHPSEDVLDDGWVDPDDMEDDEAA